MTVIERFLKYVSFDTQSDESTEVTPSTPKQMVFAQYLKTELEALGLEEITLVPVCHLAFQCRGGSTYHRFHSPHGYQSGHER